MSKILPFNDENENKSKSFIKYDKTKTSTSSSSSHHKIHRPCRSSSSMATQQSSIKSSLSNGNKFHVKNIKQSSKFRHKDIEINGDNSSDISKNKNNYRSKFNTDSNRRIRRNSHGHMRIPSLRSRSMFIKIRQKGRNFGIRCKTSVELWRKWIKRGINWNARKPVNDTLIGDDKTSSSTSKKMINETMPKPLIASTTTINKNEIHKNLITETIPEEDEQSEDNLVKTSNNEPLKKQQQSTQQSNEKKVKIEINNIKTNDNVNNNSSNSKQPNTLINDLIKMNRVKNIFMKTKSTNLSNQQAKVNDNKSNSIVNNHSNSINNNKSSNNNKHVNIEHGDDLDRIEEINDDDDDDVDDYGEDYTSNDHSNDNNKFKRKIKNSKIRNSKNSKIRRAFMKLRLFF